MFTSLDLSPYASHGLRVKSYHAYVKLVSEAFFRYRRWLIIVPLVLAVLIIILMMISRVLNWHTGYEEAQRTFGASRVVYVDEGAAWHERVFTWPGRWEETVNEAPGIVQDLAHTEAYTYVLIEQGTGSAIYAYGNGVYEERYVSLDVLTELAVRADGTLAFVRASDHTLMILPPDATTATSVAHGTSPVFVMNDAVAYLSDAEVRVTRLSDETTTTVYTGSPAPVRLVGADAWLAVVEAETGIFVTINVSSTPAQVRSQPTIGSLIGITKEGVALSALVTPEALSKTPFIRIMEVGEEGDALSLPFTTHEAAERALTTIQYVN